MTNYVSVYNFMDLLKDNGFVPQTDNSAYELGAVFMSLLGNFTKKIEMPVEPHDFMDLLHDKGVVPSSCNDNAPSNDNGLRTQAA